MSGEVSPPEEELEDMEGRNHARLASAERALNNKELKPASARKNSAETTHPRSRSAEKEDK